MLYIRVTQKTVIQSRKARVRVETAGLFLEIWTNEWLNDGEGYFGKSRGMVIYTVELLVL